MADKRLKESTLDAYRKRLATIARKCGYDEIPEGEISLWLGDKFEDMIREEKLHNAKALCNCILYYTEDEKFRELVKDNIRMVYKKNGLTQKEKTPIKGAGWKKIEDLQGIYNDLNSNYQTDIPRDIFVVLFYVYPFHNNNFPMFRNELRTLIYGTYQNDERNYYDGRNIYLTKKRSDVLETNVKIIEVPEELQRIFNNWIESGNIEEGNLILNVTTSRISQILTKYLGIGTMILRKIYDNWKSIE
jgi:hypothetical protein